MVYQRRPSLPARTRRVERCRNGHEYTPENTRLAADGTRVCLRCRLNRMIGKPAPAPAAHQSEPGPVTYKCSKCRRKLVLDETVQSPAQLLDSIRRSGWVLAPGVLCALHTAEAEAYSLPDYRHAGYPAALARTHG